jgi:hypothetical protein
VKRRLWLWVAAAMATAAGARAQDDWRRVAVPYVTPQAWLQSLDERWYAPRSAEFARAAAQLSSALTSACDLRLARTAWRDAMLAWERLAAVQTGVLLERRSARAIDFAPTRPAAIERAMRDPAADLSTVGAPALGLPALEWLLWRAPWRDGAPACAYARRVAAHLADEARALAAAYAALTARDEDAAQRDFATLVNQLVGGVATLRWAQIGKPRREGRGHWPRTMSGLTRDAWRARAQALQRLIEFTPAESEAAASAVALEPFLRGRGLNSLADRVRRTSAAMGAALATATPASAAAAERALGALEAVLGNEVAPALDVSLGFSDADGD